MNIIRDFIPEGRINRPGALNSCRYITIHETGNKSNGANAKSHARYIKTLNERTSWHYTVDDELIFQHLPENEKSYHTADAKANESSIAIELCINSDGDFEKTCKNAAELIFDLMEKYAIPAENIRSHHDWTGKNCPATLLKEGWSDFLKLFNKKESCISVDELRKLGHTSILL